MLPDLIHRYADLLLDYCTEIGSGDVVAIHAPTPAQDLARALVRGTLQRGGEPLLRLTYPAWHEDVVACASDGYLASEPDLELQEMRATDAFIRIAAPTNSRALQEADGARQARLTERQRPVTEARLDGTRWVVTLFPTASGAQDAGMSVDAFERFVFDAMYLFDDDPAARWRELGERQQRLVDRLSRAEEIHLSAPGTDLRLRVGGRTWVNSAGHRNMPSGEVFTGPLEDSAEGTVTFGVPSYVDGAEVRDARLRFEQGVVVDASAGRGEEVLLRRLERDAGARRLGELGIGTNDRIRRAIGSTLLDEKIGGTVHLALGRSYPQTGGSNDSSLHWDLVCDLREGGELRADGEVVQRDGRFLD